MPDLMEQNRRTEKRRKFNKAYFQSRMEDQEVHYVYALVDRDTKTVEYFGVINDPKARAWQHYNDLWARKDRRSVWREKHNRPPEFVIVGTFPSRTVAEIVERCLIRNFNNVGVELVNVYKYHNNRQQLSMLVQDDIPFWTVSEDDGLLPVPPLEGRYKGKSCE